MNWASITSAISFKCCAPPRPAWESGNSICSAAGRPGNRCPSNREGICAIIDEIDSVLIDEACLPLILSDSNAPAGRQEAYLEAQRVAASLREGDDFVLDSQARSVTLTRAGQQSVYEHYAGRLRFPLDRPWAEYIEQALASQYLYQRDVDYVRAGRLRDARR